MRLACDRFVAGMRADYIQENLLQTPPDSLEDARRVAKCLEAARAARRQMQTSNKAMAVHSLEGNPNSEEESLSNTGREVTMVTRADHALLEAVQQNTIAVQRLVEQMATIQS